jgi:hypothetical protein
MSNITAGTLRRWQAYGYTPNAWSVEHVHGRSERFIVGTTGRQVGKSITAGMEIDAGMCEPAGDFGPPFVGVLGSTYQKAEISVNAYIENLSRVFGRESFRVNQNKHELVILDPIAGTVGAKLLWLSADDPYGVVGFTFSKLIIDEAQAVPDEVFFKIRPTIDVKNARVTVFGTPDITQAQSWFEGMWLRGQDSQDSDYHSYSIASWETPWQKPDTILDAKKQMPESEFRRLYGGEWVNDAGRVFVDVQGAIIDESRVPAYSPDKRYVMSLDVAIYDDFNVVFVAEASTRIVVHMDRWNQADPSYTYDRAGAIWEQWGKPPIYVDATSPAGMAMTVGLRDRGLRVRNVVLTPQNKIDLVHALASDIQHRRIMFKEYEPLMQEFRAFVYGRSASGKLTAGAAAGYHDDCIMSLVLLNEGLRTRSNRASASTFGRNYLDPQRRFIKQGA